MSQPQGDTDFFISYRGARTDWALWVNWVVRSAGFTTVLMDEFPVGTDWTDQMRDACQSCQRLIPLYSTDYWLSGACRLEFDTYLTQHVKNAKARFLLPLVIEKCDVPDMHSMLLSKKLYKLDRDTAHKAILNVLSGITPVASSAKVKAEPEPPFPSLLATVSVAPPTVTLTWPPRSPTFIPDMANREREFTFFADTLSGAAREHATLISAGSDHGKTRLVAEFHRYGCEVLGTEACSLVDFKGRGTVENLLDTIASDLGARIPGLADRSPAKLREGLRKATQPVLFVFDTFESATDEAREFVERHFLADLGRSNAMRVLLAGQPQGVPDPDKATWRSYAKRFNLGTIEDPQPWVDWAKDTYRLLPANAVAAIAVSAGGVPGAIANQLAKLGALDANQLKALGIR